MSSAESSTKEYISDEAWEEMCEKVMIRKEDMNKLVMNFLVQEGYTFAADKFFEESGTAPTKNFSKILVHMSVLKAVLSRSIEDAFNVVETSYPEVLVSHARLFINLGQLQWRALYLDGDVGEASRFFKEHIAELLAINPSFEGDWSEFVKRSIEAGIGGPVTSIVKEGPLVKMVIDELEPLTAMDDLGEKKDPKITSLIKMLKKVQNELCDYCLYPLRDVD